MYSFNQIMHKNSKFHRKSYLKFYRKFWDLKNKINFSYDGASFGDIPSQTGNVHIWGELARYNGSPVAIGAYVANKKVEIFQSDSWTEVDDYPTRYFLIKKNSGNFKDI